MTANPRQLVLDLAHRSALGAEDFLVSRSNAAAVEMIDRWPQWMHLAAVVVGPAGSGKSHLAHVWRLKSGALALEASAIGETAIDLLRTKGALVVENLERGVGDERVLFHLLNMARERQQSLLLTTSRAPGDLDVALPDLRSRLRALALAVIEPPDDALLKGVLVKLFADRQLVVEPAVIAYLALHMERSMEAARAVVARIDRRALEARRKVTRALVAEVLRTPGGADEESR